MPANTSLDRSLKLIADDDTKILGLTVGTHSVTPALFIPKAGSFSKSATVPDSY